MENPQQISQDNPCQQKYDSDRKFVIFDLDGTLIDSFECVLRCVNKALDSYSLPHVDIPKCERHNDIAIIFQKARSIIKNDIYYLEFKKRFDKIHLDDCIDSVIVKSHVYSELIRLYKNGVRIVILTNKYQPIAEKVCKHFLMPIDVIIIGRKNALTLKSNCNQVIRILCNSQIQSENCLCYYGDSSEDKYIAERLKIKFLYV